MSTLKRNLPKNFVIIFLSYKIRILPLIAPSPFPGAGWGGNGWSHSKSRGGHICVSLHWIHPPQTVVILHWIRLWRCTVFTLNAKKYRAWSVELAGHLGTFLPFASHRVLPALNGEILKRWKGKVRRKKNLDDDGGRDSNHYNDMTTMMMALYDSMNMNAIITIFSSGWLHRCLPNAF